MLFNQPPDPAGAEFDLFSDGLDLEEFFHGWIIFPEIRTKYYATCKVVW